MANYGLSRPWIAKYDPATGKYSEGFKCGEAVNTSVTPAYNEASLRGDNKEVRNVKKFKNAAVTLGVTHMPLKAKSVMFGHEVDTETEQETSKTTDKSNYAGYGFISEETMDTRDVFVACVLLKVMFTEGADTYTTEGDSITFAVPSISGTAVGIDTDEWRIKKVFETEEEADQWIQEKLEVTAQHNTSEDPGEA